MLLKSLLKRKSLSIFWNMQNEAVVQMSYPFFYIYWEKRLQILKITPDISLFPNSPFVAMSPYECQIFGDKQQRQIWRVYFVRRNSKIKLWIFSWFTQVFFLHDCSIWTSIILFHNHGVYWYIILSHRMKQ